MGVIVINKKIDLFIPQYEEVFKHVLARYHGDFLKEGAHSFKPTAVNLQHRLTLTI